VDHAEVAMKTVQTCVNGCKCQRIARGEGASKTYDHEAEKAIDAAFRAASLRRQVELLVDERLKERSLRERLRRRFTALKDRVSSFFTGGR